VRCALVQNLESASESQIGVALYWAWYAGIVWMSLRLAPQQPPWQVSCNEMLYETPHGE
jgi:hypothetical protein